MCGTLRCIVHKASLSAQQIILTLTDKKNNVANSINILLHGQFFLWPSASFAWWIQDREEVRRLWAQKWMDPSCQVYRRWPACCVSVCVCVSNEQLSNKSCNLCLQVVCIFLWILFQQFDWQLLMPIWLQAAMKITQTLNNIPSLNSTLHCTSMCHIQLDFLQLAPHDAIPYNLAVNVTNILQYIHLFHQYSKWQDRTWYNIATHTIHAHTDTAHTLANLYACIQPNMPKYLLTYLQAHIISSPWHV